MNKSIINFLNFIESKTGIGNKSTLIKEVQKKFNLTKDRSVYYCEDFAVRFSSSKSTNFSNTVVSLSNLQKYDDSPFIVCLVTPKKNLSCLRQIRLWRKIVLFASASRLHFSASVGQARRGGWKGGSGGRNFCPPERKSFLEINFRIFVKIGSNFNQKAPPIFRIRILGNKLPRPTRETVLQCRRLDY